MVSLSRKDSAPGSMRPISSSSCHSNIMRDARGSESSGVPSSRNLTRMKGSMGPPHDLREYMPEHRCRLASFCFYQSQWSVLYSRRSAYQFDFVPKGYSRQTGEQGQEDAHVFIAVDDQAGTLSVGSHGSHSCRGVQIYRIIIE